MALPYSYGRAINAPVGPGQANYIAPVVIPPDPVPTTVRADNTTINASSTLYKADKV